MTEYYKYTTYIWPNWANIDSCIRNIHPIRKIQITDQKKNRSNHKSILLEIRPIHETKYHEYVSANQTNQNARFAHC